MITGKFLIIAALCLGTGEAGQSAGLTEIALSQPLAGEDHALPAGLLPWALQSEPERGDYPLLITGSLPDHQLNEYGEISRGKQPWPVITLFDRHGKAAWIHRPRAGGRPVRGHLRLSWNPLLRRLTWLNPASAWTVTLGPDGRRLWHHAPSPVRRSLQHQGPFWSGPDYLFAFVRTEKFRRSFAGLFQPRRILLQNMVAVSLTSHQISDPWQALHHFPASTFPSDKLARPAVRDLQCNADRTTTSTCYLVSSQPPVFMELAMDTGPGGRPVARVRNRRAINDGIPESIALTPAGPVVLIQNDSGDRIVLWHQGQREVLATANHGQRFSGLAAGGNRLTWMVSPLERLHLRAFRLDIYDLPRRRKVRQLHFHSRTDQERRSVQVIPVAAGWPGEV